MGVVLLSFVSLSLFVSIAYGGLIVFRWLRPVPLPVPYVRYRPERDEHVAVAESAVRAAYRDLADLYDTPTVTGPPAR